MAAIQLMADAVVNATRAAIDACEENRLASRDAAIRTHIDGVEGVWPFRRPFKRTWDEAVRAYESRGDVGLDERSTERRYWVRSSELKKIMRLAVAATEYGDGMVSLDAREAELIGLSGGAA